MRTIQYKTINTQQKINHFPGTYQIGRKDWLWINLKKLIEKFGQDQFDFIPKSYLLPYEARQLQKHCEKRKTEIWIVKPVFF